MPTTSLPGDDKLVVMFRNHPILNPAKTAAEGRPCYDDMEVCDIRSPASRSTTSVQPALMRSHWGNDEMTGEQFEVTYAERFSRQYQQFKAHQTQTMHGTPLDHVPFLTTARRAELRACNVFTVEQLADLDGERLKNIGMGGRDEKNRAVEYIAEAKARAPNQQMMAELEALRSKLTMLEEDNSALKAKALVNGADKAEGRFAAMSDDQLRDYIKTKTGHAPQGNLNSKSLRQMAMQVEPSQAA